MDNEQAIDQFFEAYRNRFDALETALQSALNRTSDQTADRLDSLHRSLATVETEAGNHLEHALKSLRNEFAAQIRDLQAQITTIADDVLSAPR